MPRIEAINLFDARHNPGLGLTLGKRTLTSDSTMAQFSGGSGYGGFAAAKLGRLTQDWAAASRSIDQELMVDLRKLRARARNQSMNSPIANKFLGMVRSNVAGKKGIKLAFKVPAQRKSAKGSGLDEKTNDLLGDAWQEWAKKGNCTVFGRFSLRELQQLWAENTARDGEQFIRKVYFNGKAPGAINRFGFALQLIDADQVDDYYNQFGAANGVQIRMGVEVDANQRPLAYHVYKGNPYEAYSSGYGERMRVPANQMYHWLVAHRTGQTRGYPWFATSMNQLNMLDGYFFAELTAARISSSMVMSIETDPNAPEQDFEGDGLNADGSKAIDIGYGKALEMPQGMHLADHTPAHPAVAFEGFVKQSGRTVASGMNVAYHKLCNDLAGINYSSGRLGELEEREFWMEMQQSMIDNVLEPVYDDWLASALLNRALDLPVDGRQRYAGKSLKWEPRRWPWVDPLKDVQAITLEIQNGLGTLEENLNARGLDLEEVLNQRKREQDLCDELGLKLGTDIRGQGTSEVNAEEDTVEDPSDPGDKQTPAGTEKPAKPKAATNKAPAKPNAKARSMELVNGMHPANAALSTLTNSYE